MTSDVPPVPEVVLLGGGHSHVQVLRSLAMKALTGARITIISRETFTPYSGMLPGHIAGFYGWHDLHIDLRPLARAAGARLIPHEVVGLDAAAARLTLDGHPPIRYDILSINSGAAPAQAGQPGIPVKPIGRFLPRWHEVRAGVRPGQRITLVGGGAGGVELALAIRRAVGEDIGVSLLTDALLTGQNPCAIRLLRDALENAGVEVDDRFRAVRVETADEGAVVIAEDGRRARTDHLFWVTGVAAPDWLRDSGLTLDPDGFVLVDDRLRSVSHPEVFASGDVAALSGQPRPKAGVFAVREGPVLTTNLRRSVLGGRLERYRAQRHYLTLIGTADGSAVASRGHWAASGRWVWRWKDRIDRRFVSRIQLRK